MKGIKVLVVEDDPGTLGVLQALLANSGVEVVAVDNATDAYVLLQTFRPHVLLSDIGLPGVDGYQFMEYVRKLSAEAGGETPAIALTAFARPEDADYALAAGFQTHLTKPIEVIELLQEIKRLAELSDKDR